jgi:ABC-2 type transport system permease protein
MRDALLIAKREYLERVRSKAFLFTTLFLALLMAIMLGGALLVPTRGGGRGRNVVLASDKLSLAESVQEQIARSSGSHMTIVIQAPVRADDHDRLTREVEEKGYDGLLWLETPPGSERPEAIYETRSSTDWFTSDILRDAITQVLTRQALAEQGFSQEKIHQMLAPVALKRMQIKNGRASNSSSLGSFAGATIMIFILYFSVVYYGMNVARSVIQEKTSRVFEVLLAITRPEALMAGKLIGVGAAGLTQMGIWFSLTLLYGYFPLAARIGKSGIGILGITLTQAVFFLLFFLLGFLFYSALSAAFGASVSTEQEIQQFSFVIVIPMVAGLVLMPYILSNPNAPAVVALSLFPPCTPTVMYLRMAAETPPLWQLLLSVVLMVAATWGMLWIASRIYRVGILMYGKRPTLPEVARWLRYS